MRRLRSLSIVGLVAAVAATTLAASEAPDGADAARVVVAVPDSASNPYHEFFHRQPSTVTPELLDEFGIDDEHIIRLTRTGDYASDYDADATKFDKVNPGELYWFEGTNLFSITFDPGRIPLLPDGNSTSHGVGTTAAVLTANPEALVISIEGINDDSEEWAFTTPFVDVVTTSYGPIGSIPLPGHINNSYVGVVENGKVHVGAADNTPALSPVDSTSGPWWSLGVAGLHEDDGRSREGLSGNLPDFVSDFTQDLPYCGNCEEGTQSVSGTSFSTPRIAGSISALILEARRQAGHAGPIVTDGVELPTLALGNGVDLTNWDLRRALEEAAWYPESSQDSGPSGLTTYAVPPQAPWSVVGWGLVTPDDRFDVLGQTLAHLDLVDREPTRFKSAEACAFMTANMEARRAYWDRVNVGSESDGSTFPYLSC